MKPEDQNNLEEAKNLSRDGSLSFCQYILILSEGLLFKEKTFSIELLFNYLSDLDAQKKTPCWCVYGLTLKI